MMWPLDAPMTRARSTKARSRSESVCDRMIRAVDDQLVMPMTTTITSRLSRIPANSLEPVPSDVADERRQDQREDERRQDEEEVGDAHRDVVEPAADVAADDPEDRPDRDGDDGREEADHHRDPRRVDRQVEHRPAELVGAERELGAGWLEASAGRRDRPSRAGPTNRSGTSASTLNTSRMSDADEAARAPHERAQQLEPDGDAARPGLGRDRHHGRRHDVTADHVRTRGSRTPYSEVGGEVRQRRPSTLRSRKTPCRTGIVAALEAPRR